MYQNMAEKKTYNPKSKEFQEEAKRLGLTGYQLMVKYNREGKYVEKDKKEVKCCICGSNDTYIDSRCCKHWYKHLCQKTTCTGYLCKRCYTKIYDNTPGCGNAVLKDLANIRTGNLVSSSKLAKATKSQKLACRLYGWEDLNEKYDNYNSPLDCFDLKTGLYHQIQGRSYSSIYGRWSFSGFEREWGKKYEDMVCFCYDKYGNIVERIYKFPENVIKNQKGITIIKYDSKGNVYDCGWYEEYGRADKDELKKANEIWKEIINMK